MKQNLDLDMQTIGAVLSPKCLRLPGSQVELMDLHKIMMQPFLSLPVRFETIIPKNRTFLVFSSNSGNFGTQLKAWLKLAWLKWKSHYRHKTEKENETQMKIV